MPSTGGWYNWEELVTQGVEIGGGEKFLKIQIVQAGFNIESISFESTMGAKDQDVISESFYLGKPYPNPFNPRVSMKININETGELNFSVYSLRGELIQSWSKNIFTTGFYTLEWDGFDRFGNESSSGIYIINATSKDYGMQRKVILLR